MVSHGLVILINYVHTAIVCLDGATEGNCQTVFVDLNCLNAALHLLPVATYSNKIVEEEKERFAWLY
jgi:hypothetical protein